MSEQSGIDILCDAAGSALFSPEALSLSLSATDRGRPDRPGPLEEHAKSPKRPKRGETGPASSSSPTHICHICKRVYERADHLTRHLRSHENARSYQCTRCPKRFNRADLLTRHEATHDRDAGSSRPVIRRSDRAVSACGACAAAKAKCDDQKPCGRCRSKKLVCQTSRRGFQYKTYSEGDPSADGDEMGLNAPTDAQGTSINADSCSDAATVGNGGLPASQAPLSKTTEPVVFPMDTIAPVAMQPVPDDMVYFNPMHNLFQDIDLDMSWDLDFDAFPIPQLEVQVPSPGQSSNARSSTRNAFRDPSRGHAAFKRSPWLWEPKQEDYVRREKEGLDIDEQSLAQSPNLGRLTEATRGLRINSHQRDRIFSIVLAQNKDPTKVPSFPSLELLSYLLQASFIGDEYLLDSWIHAPSFDTETTMPELLAAIISNGATFISVPAIWQFGLAIQEVVRLGLAHAFEASNAKTRNLAALQAFMLYLDVGMWSGFKRKMEIAESFCQPVLTMLRRAGSFSAPIDSSSLIPLESDSPETIESKWRDFINRESLILHLFIHDVETSISLQINHLLSFSELAFSLPASRDLWRAPTAETWRRIYLSKRRLARPLPRVSELGMHVLDELDELQDNIDIELCYQAVLHSFWGQIAAYRGSTEFYANSNGGNNRLWLKSQHQELNHDLCSLSTIIHTSSFLSHSTYLALVCETFLMILHVSPSDLQRFAGKFGEDEARRAASSLEESWVNTPESRYATWHAGQVLLNARRLPPASLRGFNAIAVYLASLTLWAYGLLVYTPAAPGELQEHMLPQQQQADGLVHLQPGAYGQQQQQQQMGTERRASPGSGVGGGGAGGIGVGTTTARCVYLDGEETRDTKAFLQMGRGVPALSTSGGAVEMLSNPAGVLSIARDVFRENFPVRSEPLPPLVESLGNLLRDLGSGAAGNGMSSRVVSNVASRLCSEERL